MIVHFKKHINSGIQGMTFTDILWTLSTAVHSSVQIFQQLT